MASQEQVLTHKRNNVAVRVPRRLVVPFVGVFLVPKCFIEGRTQETLKFGNARCRVHQSMMYHCVVLFFESAEFTVGGWENVIDKPGNRVPVQCPSRA